MGFLKALSGYKRVAISVLAMGAAAFSVVPPEWQGWALGITGALTGLSKLIDNFVPSDV